MSNYHSKLKIILSILFLTFTFILLGSIYAISSCNSECGFCPPGTTCMFCFGQWQCVPKGAQC